MNLLDKTSPRYLKRLTREINAECRNNGASFVSCGNSVKIKHAKYSKEHNEISCTTFDGIACALNTEEIETLIDGIGKSICASRHV